MIRIGVAFDDKVTEALKQFASSAPKMLDRILLSIGGKYAQYLKRGYLSGQMMGVRTGKLRKKMKARLTYGKHHDVVIRAGLGNIYEHREGIEIAPRKAKMLHWVGQDGKDVWARHVHLNPQPFMTLSSQNFGWTAALEESAERMVTIEGKKRGL